MFLFHWATCPDQVDPEQFLTALMTVKREIWLIQKYSLLMFPSLQMITFIGISQGI